MIGGERRMFIVLPSDHHAYVAPSRADIPSGPPHVDLASMNPPLRRSGAMVHIEPAPPANANQNRKAPPKFKVALANARDAVHRAAAEKLAKQSAAPAPGERSQLVKWATEVPPASEAAPPSPRSIVSSLQSTHTGTTGSKSSRSILKGQGGGKSRRTGIEVQALGGLSDHDEMYGEEAEEWRQSPHKGAVRVSSNVRRSQHL